MPTKLPPEIVERGRAKARTPEIKEKIRTSKIGKPANPSIRAGLLRAAKRPKSEAWKQKMSKIMREKWKAKKIEVEYNAGTADD